MKTRVGLIPVLIAMVLAAALAVPLLGVGAPPSQADVNSIDISTPTPTPTPTPVPQGGSSDQVGVGKDVYNVLEIVYAMGSGFPGSSFVDVYIVLDDAWTNGDTIPPDVSSDGVNMNVPTDGAGNLAPVNIWDPPLTPGEYDIVFDENVDPGVYDPPQDVVDDPNHPGFSVIGPVGGIVEPVDPSEPGATSGESLDGTSTTTFVAVGIGVAVLLAAFLVWTLRRGRAASAGKSQ